MKGTEHRGLSIVKAHAYVFYLLRSTAKAAWNDGFEDGKAVMVMTLAMLLVGITLACIVSILLKHRVFLPNTKLYFVGLWSGIMGGFLVLNQYSLIYKKKWRRFEHEFQLQPSTTRIAATIAVWVAVILIVAAAEWTGSIALKLPSS